MGPRLSFKTKETKLAVGDKIASVLPKNAKPWYLTKHLLVLNIILFIPFLSQAVVGYDGTMMNGLQSLSQWRSFFHQPAASILGTMNAMYPLGKFFGLFFAAYFGDRFGRRWPLYIGLALLILGGGIQGGAHNLAMFVIGRLLLGFGTAFVNQSSPILISELAYPTHRAKITSIWYSTYYLGAIIAAWTTYGTFHIQSDYSWRIPSYLQVAIPVFQVIVVYFVPESPRWLIANDRVEEARKFFVKYHAGGEEDSALVDFEMREIQETIREEALVNSQTSYLDLIRTPQNRRRTIIGMIVGWYATFSGIAVISYYLVLVLNTIGITQGSTQALINGILQIFNLFVAIFSGALIDRMGRRPLWLTSAVGMCLSFVIWTVLSSRFAVTQDPAIGKAVLAFIFIWSFFYGGGFSPLIVAYPIEIFPYTLRGRGLTISIATIEIGLIIGQFVNPVALSAVGWKYYIFFCLELALFCVLVYFLFPETKGHTLEEIAEIFDGKKEKDPENLGTKSAEQDVLEVEYSSKRQESVDAEQVN